MRKVQFTETVLRDANQSLIATRLPYSKFEPILETMDKAGFYSAEVWGGATFDVCLRYLREDPWERLRKIRAKMPNTKLQMLLRGQNILGYKHYPDDVVRKFVEYSVKNGIDIIRIFDALNDVRNLEVAIDETNKQGAHASGTGRGRFLSHGGRHEKNPCPFAGPFAAACLPRQPEGSRQLHPVHFLPEYSGQPGPAGGE